MNDIPRGPENIPLKAVITKCIIVVLIKDLKSKEIIRKESIDYSDREARQWLGKVSYWAWTSGYSIETMLEVV